MAAVVRWPGTALARGWEGRHGAQPHVPDPAALELLLGATLVALRTRQRSARKPPTAQAPTSA
ncbi:hypothetical protein ACGF5O_11465 [Streptomyces sp. NPDC048291]|uniref:hypothetical protein n=1 Tax=Streptomyces sp. NPDC048291 TaxID=3365530 RepID=UPI00371D9139